MLRGNKGEWSEIYVFLYLLAAGRLYAADADLNKIKSAYYEILKILRDEDFGKLEFCVNNTNAAIDIKSIDNGNLIASIPMKIFGRWARFLFSQIQGNSKSVFTVPAVEKFLQGFYVKTLKAKNSSKADIRIQIHDINSGLNLIQGFSIKSRLGSPSTLINAGKTTNFIYEITGDLPADYIQKINSCRKFADKFSLLYALNCKLHYQTMENSTFEGNLLLIDSSLPQICSHLLLEYYQGSSSSAEDVLNVVEKVNPLNYNLALGQPFYQYKFKKLLSESALGMLPSKPWQGIADATGGYIVVKENGDVLCYHLFNRNEFEQYLLSNTRFETASTSRHDFGHIFTDASGRNFIKLNLQIRFIK